MTLDLLLALFGGPPAGVTPFVAHRPPPGIDEDDDEENERPIGDPDDDEDWDEDDEDDDEEPLQVRGAVRSSPPPG
jgi:hypothetical protein